MKPHPAPARTVTKKPLSPDMKVARKMFSEWYKANFFKDNCEPNHYYKLREAFLAGWFLTTYRGRG